MKKGIILVGRDGRPSMKTVYRKMCQPEVVMNVVRTPPRTKKRYIREYVNNNADVMRKRPLELSYPGTVMIRWGNRIEAATDGGTITYNKSEAIRKATNKKESREIFMANNVRTSRLVNPTNVQDNQHPIIARPFTHSKGRNFVTLPNLDSFTRHYNANNATWYYSEFIDKEREFRVHCAHGKVLAVMEKPRATGIAWNRAQNHEAFNRVQQTDYIHDVCLQALSACKALELDFAGIDVLYKEGQAYVLEANTSPTLNSSEYVSERYAHYFDWLFAGETRRPHWDYTAFKKATSFSWKEKQFV